MIAAALVLMLAAQDPVVIRTVEAASDAAFPALELAAGEIGVALGASEVAAAAGFAAPPFKKGGVSVVTDPKAADGDLVVWVTSLPRDQAAAALRESPKVRVCIVTGKGGGDPEPLKIGDAYMVQAPGSSGLWGRIEVRGGVVTNAFAAPAGKASDKVAAAKKKLGVPVDAMRELADKARPPAPAPVASLETSNRACKFRIFSTTTRAAYGSKSAAPGRKLMVLDAELENIIPMTLVRNNQVPTIYRIKNLGDHLYLVVNGERVSRILPDAAQLAGHVTTTPLELERLGSKLRGNIVFDVPADGVKTLDLRFYDYAHGHMTLVLQEGERTEAKPVLPLAENDVLEAGLYKVEKAPAADGMARVTVEFRARSRMFTEGDATAFDPKAAPGSKLQIGTVSDWTDLRRHLNVLVDGTKSFPLAGELEIGESPRFLPDVMTGGKGSFLVPEKAASLELRCDFPNARLPDGTVVHPKALLFTLEGKRPEPAAPAAAIVSIDDDIYKVVVIGQAMVAEHAGVKAGAGKTFLVLDVTVTGAGKAGEMFQTPEQLFYATEKGAQIAMHAASYKGSAPAEKLLLVPTGERRSFQAVYEVPSTEKRLRLSYRGVTKAQIVELKPLEGAPAEAAKRLCPKCKAAAEPNEKFCAECGTKLEGTK